MGRDVRKTPPWRKLCNIAESLRRLTSPTAARVTTLWKKFFDVYLKEELGFNDRAVQVLFHWGKDGHNWTILHEENQSGYNEHTAASPELAYRNFSAEVDYISDRCSMDRLLRAHWMYNLYITKQRHADLQTRTDAAIEKKLMENNNGNPN